LSSKHPSIKARRPSLRKVSIDPRSAG
jgi:hypothetical protein